MDILKGIRLPAPIGAYLSRLVLPAVAIGLFIVFNSVYNAWAELTQYNLIRRSVASLALGALLFGPAVLMRMRRQALYLGLVWLALGLLFTANLVYAWYAGGFLSASSLSYLWQVGDTTGSIKSLLDPRLALFFGPGVLFLALIWPVGKLHLPGLQLTKSVVALTLGGTVLLAGAGYGYVAVKELQQYGDLTRVTDHPFDSTEFVRKIGIVNYSLVDLVNYLRRKRSLTAAEVKFVEEHKAAAVSVHEHNDATGALAGRNVVFLQLESFQEFLIGKEVKGQVITPNLNRLAGEGRQYTNFHYSIGPGTSSDGEFVTFNSLLHLANQAVVFDYPASDYHAFPQILKQAGYQTAAYHADSKNFWNRANTFPRFGFDEFVAEEGYAPGAMIGFGLNDKDFLDQTVDKLAALKPPFYAHVISLSSHSPYKLPKEYQSLDLSGVALTELQLDYLQAAHYTDTAIGEFMVKMREKGLLEKTAFVIMGDHEGFIIDKGEDVFAKFLGESRPFDDISRLAASRIPFIIYAPGSAVTGRSDKLGSQIDVYPTLLNLLGQTVPLSVMGVDLNGPAPGLVVKRQRGLGPSIHIALEEDLFYTSHSYADGHPACYRSGSKVGNDDCKGLLDKAVNRAQVSDLVIVGNRIDLLK